MTRKSPPLLRIWRGLNLVHPYQFTIYLSVFLWGIYSIASSTPAMVADILPRPFYLIWMYTHIAAPLAVWTGQFLHQRKATPKKTLLGWELQWAGDAAIFFNMATEALAFTQGVTPYYIYLIPLFASWALCAFMLSFRDLIAIGYYWGICHDRYDDSRGDA